MKRTYLLVTGIFLAVALGLPHSCKKPTDGVDLIITTDFTEATTSFQFVDAVNGEQIGLENTAEKITLVMNGADKALIVNNASGSSLACTDGFITLALKKGTIPSASSPVNFNITASASGFLSTTVDVKITEKGTQHYLVRMIRLSNTPQGVAAVQNSTLTANGAGVVATQLKLATPAVTTSGEATAAEITIPAGTILKDKNNAVVAGTITSTLVYFNNLDEASANSFPGGNGYSGQVAGQDIYFNPGGFYSMQMRSGGGKEVKNFGGSSVHMRVEVPNGTTDASGNPIQIGTPVPVYSYSDDTGEWTQESTANISVNGTSGKMEVTFDMVHLSYWTISWPRTGCEEGATLKFNTNYSSVKNALVVLKTKTGTALGSKTIDITNGASYTLQKTPSLDVDLTAYPDGVSSGTGYSINIPDACSGTHELTIVDPDAVSITATVNGTCADRPNQIIRPSVTVYAQNVGEKTWFYVGEMHEGKITTSALKKGKSYRIAVSYANQRIESEDTYTVNELEYSLNQIIDPSICKLIN